MNENPMTWDPVAVWKIQEAIHSCSGPNPVVVPFHRGEPLKRYFGEKWAVFCSSFNPPTRAHEALVRWALEEGGFEKVLLLLDVRHAEKLKEDAVSEDRALMMIGAFGGDTNVTLGFSSHGRYLDKLTALDGLFREPEEKKTFLIGEDNISRLLDPVFYSDPDAELQAVFDQAAFVVFARPVESADSTKKTDADPFVLMKKWLKKGAKVTRIELGEELAVVSSSGVRNYVEKNGSRPPWVCDGVADFILETGLYSKESPDGPSLYGARKQLLNRLFSCSSPDEFGIEDLKREAERLCGEPR